MGTIAESEMAIQSERIIEGYDFLIGTTHYFYTSDSVNRTIGGQLYTAITIERTGFTYCTDLSIRQCTISIPNTSAIALLLRINTELQNVQVSINRYFSDDLAEVESIFVGFATGINFSSGFCNIVFSNIALELEREICRVRMQALCNNQLFDSICGLFADDYEVAAEVTVASGGKTLTSATFATKPANYFTLGKILYSGSYRFISYHIGNTIKIHFPIIGLASGMTITAWPGCPKTPVACIGKFLATNIDSFVGMPYIPLKDSTQTAITNV